MADPLFHIPSIREMVKDFPYEDRPTRRLIERLSSGVVYWEDDFLGDLIKDEWAVNKNGTGSANLVALADTVNGEATLVTGTDDNGYAYASLGSLQFAGNQNAMMAVRLKCSAITTLKVECGFTDATGDAGAVNVLATPTYTADDCALWCFDTDDTAYLQGIGVTATSGMTKLEPAENPALATTYQTLIVALQDTAAKYLVLDANEQVTYESPWQQTAITAATKLTPWIFAQARAGSADRTVTLDYMKVWQRRTTANLIRN